MSQIRIKHNFDFDWKFRQGSFSKAPGMNFDDSAWETVQMPHDYCIGQKQFSRDYASNGFLALKKGCYRKTFRIPRQFKGKRVSILFDGVFQRATVYLNSEQIGYQAYGFTPFELDLTSKIIWDKDNVIAVTVDPADACRWYSGAGIYRHVWLQAVSEIHVAANGTYVTTPEISPKKAVINVVSTIQNDSAESRKIEVLQTVFDATGKSVAEFPAKSVTVAGGKAADINQAGTIRNPRLWDIDSPNLYSLLTTVKVDGGIVDEYTTTFGIRSIRFETHGFFLNDCPVKFKGMCLHHDAGPLGTAVPDRSYERRLEILKEYGVNAIRCSHNPPSPEFLDLCDRLGFVVIDEAFDKWKAGYYKEIFDANWETDMNAMLQRDRNHPCIVIWSIGNEVVEVKDETDEGLERTKMLHDYIRKNEPTRPTILALQYRFLQKYADVTDLIGYNYLERQAIKDHREKPARKFIITEALQYYTAGWGGAFRGVEERNPWSFVLENDFILGSFIWTGVDYIGEAVHPSTKGWPCAPFDSCMNEKPFGAYHRSFWNPEPMVKVALVANGLDYNPGKDMWQFPNMVHHWNLPYRDERMVELRVVSTCDYTELLINGRSVGARDRSFFKDNATPWIIAWQPGTVEVKGYDRTGKELVSDKIVTAGKAASFKLTPDRDTIKADGQDLSHIELELFDENGNRVYVDDREVTVKVEGAGRFRGIDNGDLRRKISYASSRLPTWQGRAQIIVQSSRNSGKIKILVAVKDISQPIELEIAAISTKFMN